ncbi:hypothetical protein ACHAXT_006088 [Thalassiosira profunda]
MPSDDGGVGGGNGTDASDYVEMPSIAPLSPHEIAVIRRFLNSGDRGGLSKEERSQTPMQDEQFRSSLQSAPSAESEQSEFRQTSHAWLIREESDRAALKQRNRIDRVVGALIVGFQLFTYYLFAIEAIEDYRQGPVAVYTTHGACLESGFSPEDNLLCDAEKAYPGDSFVSFFMLSMYLASDVQQALRSLKKATSWLTLLSAAFVALEVLTAFIAASISISQKLYVGEVTDAIEAAVGLLFIRELSTRAYEGIKQQKKRRAYLSFFLVLVSGVVLGMLVHPICAALLAP